MRRAQMDRRRAANARPDWRTLTMNPFLIWFLDLFPENWYKGFVWSD